MVPMKVIALIGSRGKQGRTAKAANAWMDGFRSAGGEVEAFFLPELKIERCRQCDDDGWGLCLREGKCIITDDMQKLAEGIKKADAVLMATPVYWGELSESLRAFIDRLRRTALHHDGKKGIAEKPVFGICVAGGGGGAAPECAGRMERILRDCGFHLEDVVPARRQNLDYKLEVLKTSGAAFARRK